eukprot:gene28164-37064_t
MTSFMMVYVLAAGAVAILSDRFILVGYRRMRYK